MFGIVLVTSKRIEIQSYAFWNRVVEGKEMIEFDLVNFEQFADGEHVKVAISDGKMWFGLIPIYGGMSGGPYSMIRLFENDWKEKFEVNQSLST